MTETITPDTKEQLNIAQKRLNAALNALEEIIGKKTQEANHIKEATETHKTQADELQTYVFELEQHNTALATKLHQKETQHHQLLLAYQEISQELAQTIQTLQDILAKHSQLEPCQ